MFLGGDIRRTDILRTHICIKVNIKDCRLCVERTDDIQAYARRILLDDVCFG